MMAKLLARGNALGRAAERRRIAEFAEMVRGLLAGATIDVIEAQMILSGRGLLRRWLTDPSIRFLGGGTK